MSGRPFSFGRLRFGRYLLGGVCGGVLLGALTAQPANALSINLGFVNISADIGTLVDASQNEIYSVEYVTNSYFFEYITNVITNRVINNIDRSTTINNYYGGQSQPRTGDGPFGSGRRSSVDEDDVVRSDVIVQVPQTPNGDVDRKRPVTVTEFLRRNGDGFIAKPESAVIQIVSPVVGTPSTTVHPSVPPPPVWQPGPPNVFHPGTTSRPARGIQGTNTPLFFPVAGFPTGRMPTGVSLPAGVPPPAPVRSGVAATKMRCTCTPQTPQYCTTIAGKKNTAAPYFIAWCNGARQQARNWLKNWRQNIRNIAGRAIGSVIKNGVACALAKLPAGVNDDWLATFFPNVDFTKLPVCKSTSVNNVGTVINNYFTQFQPAREQCSIDTAKPEGFDCEDQIQQQVSGRFTQGVPLDSAGNVVYERTPLYMAAIFNSSTRRTVCYDRASSHAAAFGVRPSGVRIPHTTRHPNAPYAYTAHGQVLRGIPPGVLFPFLNPAFQPFPASGLVSLANGNTLRLNVNPYPGASSGSFDTVALGWSGAAYTVIGQPDNGFPGNLTIEQCIERSVVRYIPGNTNDNGTENRGLPYRFEKGSVPRVLGPAASFSLGQLAPYGHDFLLGEVTTFAQPVALNPRQSCTIDTTTVLANGRAEASIILGKCVLNTPQTVDGTKYLPLSTVGSVVGAAPSKTWVCQDPSAPASMAGVLTIIHDDDGDGEPNVCDPEYTGPGKMTPRVTTCIPIYEYVSASSSRLLGVDCNGDGIADAPPPSRPPQSPAVGTPNTPATGATPQFTLNVYDPRKDPACRLIVIQAHGYVGYSCHDPAQREVHNQVDYSLSGLPWHNGVCACKDNSARCIDRRRTPGNEENVLCANNGGGQQGGSAEQGDDATPGDGDGRYVPPATPPTTAPAAPAPYVVDEVPATSSGGVRNRYQVCVQQRAISSRPQDFDCERIKDLCASLERQIAAALLPDSGVNSSSLADMRRDRLLICGGNAATDVDATICKRDPQVCDKLDAIAANTARAAAAAEAAQQATAGETDIGLCGDGETAATDPDCAEQADTDAIDQFAGYFDALVTEECFDDDGAAVACDLSDLADQVAHGIGTGAGSGSGGDDRVGGGGLGIVSRLDYGQAGSGGVAGGCRRDFFRLLYGQVSTGSPLLSSDVRVPDHVFSIVGTELTIAQRWKRAALVGAAGAVDTVQDSELINRMILTFCPANPTASEICWDFSNVLPSRDTRLYGVNTTAADGKICIWKASEQATPLTPSWAVVWMGKVGYLIAWLAGGFMFIRQVFN